VALEMSDDPSTRENGGNLGWTATEVLLPGVKEVVDTLEVGGVSPVLSSDRGFHVFKVTNRRTGGEFTYEEIEDQLRGFLEQKKLTEVYDEWMAGIRDSAYVEIKAWER
jgi:parvulin-like peptidyl-prolyl isomerase